MIIAAVILLSISLCFVLFHCYFTALWKTQKRTVASFSRDLLPMVSILKPVKNAEKGFDSNIDSFYHLDYPEFEMIFALETESEAEREIIEMISRRYPHIVTKIIYTGRKKAGNPKIDNLVKMERVAQGSLYWICDANIEVETDTLSSLVHEYVTKNSKLIFSPIRGTGSETLGSIIENSYINFFVSGNIMTAWKLAKQPIVVGKSMLMEKETLVREFGGFEFFREFLCEDYVMGLYYTRRKIPISTNFTWVTNIIRENSISQFFSRMSRWAVLRFHLRRGFYLSELILNPIVIALLFLPFTGETGFFLLWFAVMVKVSAEYLNFMVNNKRDRRKLWITVVFPIAVIMKDILSFFIYLTPIFTDRVNWRGRTIRVGKDSRIIPDEGTLFPHPAEEVQQ